MKTLVVTYLPRGEQSYTKKLVDAFLDIVDPQNVEVIDLLQDMPDVFTQECLEAYTQRNYMGQKLDAAHQKAIAKMDRMAAQFKAAEVVVIASPMHNFSLPALTKAYFDSVMLKGVTWDILEGGKFAGLMTGKKALILLASGGVYEGAMASWDHAVSLAKLEFQFMGFSDIRAVTAAGMNAGKRKPEEIVAEAQEKVRAIVGEWYS